jgi:putative spermidine/putrescine transport system permease protein
MNAAPAPLRGALFVLLALWALVPLLLLLLVSLGGEWFWPAILPPRWDLEGWAALAADGARGRLGRAGVNSLALAVGTGAAASLAGLPIGRALAGLRGHRRRLGAAAAFLPVAAPPIALAIGLQYTFLRLGLGGTGAGVLLAHLVPALGYTALFFLGIFAGWDGRVEEEARSLGARPRQVFLRVTLPLLRRPLIEAFVLGFLVSWAQVPLTLLVGQGLVPTLSVEVLAFVQAGQDRLAATGALLLVAPPLLLLAAAGFAIRRAAVVAV